MPSCPIHRSAWKGCSKKFGFRGFSEVRPGLVHSGALIRSHKILKRMEAAYRHELMGEAEREKGKTSIGAARDVGTAPIRENKFEGYE